MITQENITKLQDYNVKISALKEAIDNEYELVREGSKERSHKLVRNIDGVDTEVDIKEDDLWYELEKLGLESQAGKFLTEKYPEFIAKVKENNDVVAEMTDYSIKTIGINPLKISLIDIINIVTGIIDGRK